jgi:hypothetical protein
MTLEEVRHWQAQCRDVYGIATRIKRAGSQSYVAEHDADACCGQESHDPYTRNGACAAHYAFGASAFCLICRPEKRVSVAAREAAEAARKASA